MASIELSPHPLAFAVGNAEQTIFKQLSRAAHSDAISIRTCTRSLDGMQKEAVVDYGPSGTVWRMVCDEGPYLNGTDLAPFPLAFFAAGMAASVMSEIVALLKQQKIAYKGICLTQDNRYSMEGSAVKGTMTGGALPVEFKLHVDSSASQAIIQQVMSDAIAASPATALLRDTNVSEFSITLNGQPLQTKKVKPLEARAPSSPEGFDDIAPDLATTTSDDIISKYQSTETIFGVDGGAGSSLEGDQKRILHMRSICTLREDEIKEIKVQLFKPIGSVFHFLSDDSKAFGGQERAPSGLAYLSAGLAFCYMTQLGRYSHIVRKPLDLYRIIQDTHFSLPGASGNTGKLASSDPVKTHVMIDYTNPDIEAGEQYTQTLVDMGEQTCFLHAACRDSVKAKIKS